MICVLGAGISGISAAYHLGLKKKAVAVFEKRDRWGGLCDNFQVDGFRFDHFIHLSFSDNAYVKQLFAQSSDYLSHKPESLNYYRGYWLRHPAQNNLYPLPIDEKIEIIEGFVKSLKKDIEIFHYEDWLRQQYGNYFAEHFPLQYTKKYWTVEAKELSTSWIGQRMYKPTLREILKGAFSRDIPNTHYAKEMRYPVKGGYKSFLNKMANQCTIKLNKNAILIIPDEKLIYFSDNSKTKYSALISSIPLPEIVKLLPNAPEHVKIAANNLKFTSGAIVSLGFNKTDIPKKLWFYIYDLGILPARVYSPSMKSLDNVPNGCSSLQFETYFCGDITPKYSKDYLLDHVIEKSIKIGIMKKDDICFKDYRTVQYANIIFDHGTEVNRKIVLEYLNSINIYSIGRFGEWEYFWSDHSLLSGKKVTANWGRIEKKNGHI